MEIDGLAKPHPPNFRCSISTGHISFWVRLWHTLGSFHSDLFVIYNVKAQNHQQRHLWIDFLTRSIRNKLQNICCKNISNEYIAAFKLCKKLSLSAYQTPGNCHQGWDQVR